VFFPIDNPVIHFMGNVFSNCGGGITPPKSRPFPSSKKQQPDAVPHPPTLCQSRFTRSPRLRSSQFSSRSPSCVSGSSTPRLPTSPRTPLQYLRRFSLFQTEASTQTEASFPPGQETPWASYFATKSTPVMANSVAKWVGEDSVLLTTVVPQPPKPCQNRAPRVRSSQPSSATSTPRVEVRPSPRVFQTEASMQTEASFPPREEIDLNCSRQSLYFFSEFPRMINGTR